MSMQLPVDTKARLRESMLSLLRSVDGPRALEAGEAVAKHLVEHPGWQRASVIACFSAIRGEVDA